MFQPSERVLRRDGGNESWTDSPEEGCENDFPPYICSVTWCPSRSRDRLTVRQLSPSVQTFQGPPEMWHLPPAASAPVSVRLSAAGLIPGPESLCSGHAVHCPRPCSARLGADGGMMTSAHACLSRQRNQGDCPRGLWPGSAHRGLLAPREGGSLSLLRADTDVPMAHERVGSDLLQTKKAGVQNQKPRR